MKMFYSYKDTKEKLDYLESSKIGRESPININWLIETLRETNEKAERYEEVLKDIKNVSILNEIKELINDERITKSETIDKISKIVNR